MSKQHKLNKSLGGLTNRQVFDSSKDLQIIKEKPHAEEYYSNMEKIGKNEKIDKNEGKNQIIDPSRRPNSKNMEEFKKHF